MTLVDAFTSAAASRQSKTAIFWGDKEFSYATVQDESSRIASLLQSEYEVRAGDRVGLWLRNRPEFIFGLLGILKSGAVAVPINNFLKPHEVRYILDDAGIDVLITDEELSAYVSSLTSARPGLKVLNVEASIQSSVFSIQTQHASRGVESGTINHQLSTINSASLAVLIYTSGTTGRPKGAMLSHGNLIHNVESCREVLQVSENDRIAVMLPMFHSYMLTVGVLLPLLVGGSIVVVKSLHPIRPKTRVR